MGFLNNQWLEGGPLRARKHNPISVSISAEDISNPWDVENKVQAALYLKRANGDYQHLLFTEQDTEALVKAIGSAGASMRQQIAVSAMAGLSITSLSRSSKHCSRNVAQ